MKSRSRTREILNANIIASSKNDDHGAKIRGHWDITCKGADGSVKWTDVIENIVVNVGLDYALGTALASTAQITTWFVGLTTGSPSPAASDTMASHAGWTENSAGYSNATRVTWSNGAESGQSVSNSGSPATFSITASTTAGGSFLVSNSTKGGTAGTLYAIGAFSGGNRVLVNGDTLLVTATYTMADDGV